MATGRRDLPAETARDGPSTDAGVDAWTNEALARFRALRARSERLRAKGQGLRQSPVPRRWERQLDQLAHDIDLYTAGVQRRAQETMGSAQPRPATGRDRLGRSGAALHRPETGTQRAQVQINSPAAESKRELDYQPPPDLGEQVERAKALRRKLAVTAAALATAEEDIARAHEELAGLRPAQASAYCAIAEAARQVARQARGIEHQYRG